MNEQPIATARPPTQVQLDTLAFMHAFIAEHGYPPTIAEIKQHFGVKSSNGIWQRLTAMKRKGLVRHEPFISRGWRPV